MKFYLQKNLFDILKEKTQTHERSILEKELASLFAYSAYYSKTMIVRFDIRFPEDLTELCRNGQNEDVLRKKVNSFMEVGSRYFRRKQFSPFYFIVPEKNNAEKTFHYHCYFLLNAQTVKEEFPILIRLNELWKKKINADKDGLIDFCYDRHNSRKGYNGIVLEHCKAQYSDTFCSVIKQISYLAKKESKELLEPNQKSFRSSQLYSIGKNDLKASSENKKVIDSIKRNVQKLLDIVYSEQNEFPHDFILFDSAEFIKPGQTQLQQA